MRGDYAPLDKITGFAKKYESEFPEGIVVMVDDSHGVGAFGETGRGEEEYTKAIGALSELPPDETKALVSQQAGRLRELAGGTSADQRLAAVQALSRAGTLDDVPTLIYVLTDPEAEIVLAARSGLRRISRKILGFEMPDDFDESDRRTAIDNWKAWYLAIRPDAEFEI